MIEHGTPSTYNAGCHCDECKAANTARQRARRTAIRAGTYQPRTYIKGNKRKPKPPKSPVPLPPHETHARYVSRTDPCHEACCRSANAEYMRKYRAR